VVDRLTAERFGWKPGEHIPLEGANYDYNLDLTLSGIYEGPDWIQGLFFHWEYLDEGLRQKESPLAGNAGFYFVKAASEDVIPRICESIDRGFASSEFPTWTQSHQEFARLFAKFLGNIQAYIRNIGLAVVFALTLVAANSMAMSMRERTVEVALLKAIGFRPPLVLALVLGEAVLVAAIGGVLGVAAAQALWAAVHQMFPQYLPLGHIAWMVVVYGIIVAIAIGLVSGLVPAIRAARLSVIDGLRRLG
jgi:putative ABC transport system permease protein